jgi:hypothetical protein
MSSAAQVSILVQVPALSQIIPVSVHLAGHFSDLISQILAKAAITEAVPGYHLYGLTDEFKAFRDDALCSTLFMKTYRQFVLQAGSYKPVTVMFEGRIADIDVPELTLLGDLIYIASQCFSFSIVDECYIAVDSATMVVLHVDDPVTAPLIVLKRFHLYSANLTFASSISIGRVAMPMITLPKVLLAAPIKSLLSGKRGEKGTEPLQFAEIAEDRLKVLLKDTSLATPAEQNSLLFLLFGTNEKPMFSEVLHKQIITIASQPSDAKKFEDLLVLLLFLPIHVHCFLSEISLPYGGLLPLESNRVTVNAIIRQLLFGDSETEAVEAEFVSFLMMCSKWLFKLQRSPEAKLFIDGDRLVLVDGKAAMTASGPCPVPAGKKEFATDQDVPELALEFVDGLAAPAGPPPGKPADFSTLNQELKDFAELLAYRGKAPPPERPIMEIPFEEII